MAKMIWLLPAFALTVLTAAAQADYELESFDGISATGNIKVILEQGDEETAHVRAEGIPESEVTVKVREGELKLKLINSIFYKDEEVAVYVIYRSLRSIKGHAGAQIEGANPIEADLLKVRSASGAHVSLQVAVNAIEGSASEGGILQLSGVTESQKAASATGGHYDALDLQCARTYARANTGGRTEVVANERLEASANTGGTINYRGEPATTEIKSVISGNVNKI